MLMMTMMKWYIYSSDTEAANDRVQRLSSLPWEL